MGIMNLEQMKAVTDNFLIEGDLIHVERFGEGHINQTYAVYYAFVNKPTVRYIVQKISTTAFKNPEKLNENIFLVTEYLKEKIRKNGGDETRETLSLIPTKKGESFHKTEIGEYFRIYKFIENATCFQTATKETYYQSAKAFGKFSKALDGFDAELLFDTIENFHNSENRYKNFEISLEKDTVGRVSGLENDINFVKERKDFCSIILKEIRNGNIPLRVCHNDTKLNNVMMDNETNVGVCVIDLDTVMKGSLLYDFGDSIRFGTNTAAEDEADLDKVTCDLDMYRAFAQGYLEECSSMLSEKEFELLGEAAILMTFECGIRFLSDHFDGDVYFRVTKENHNLLRARNQFKLVQDMEAKLPQMKIINKEIIEQTNK